MIHVTPWFMLAAFLAIVAYDVIAYLRGGAQATISRITLATLSRFPIIALTLGLALGALLGHLAWPQPNPGLCP